MSAAKVSLVAVPLRTEEKTYHQGKLLLAELLKDPYSRWLALAALAFIYGSAVTATVIVTLIKSARNLNPEARRRR